MDNNFEDIIEVAFLERDLKQDADCGCDCDECLCGDCKL